MLLWASVIFCMIANLLRPLTYFKWEHCVLNLSFPLCTFSYEPMYYEVRYGSKALLLLLLLLLLSSSSYSSSSSSPSFQRGAGKSFLPYPLDSNTVQLGDDHRCSNQSCAFNALLADVVDVATRQRVVTEFLTTEGSSPIHP